MKNGKPDTEIEIDTPDLPQGPLPFTTQPKPHTDQGQDSCAPMMETICDGPWRLARVKAPKNEIAQPTAKVNRLSKTHSATAGQESNAVLRGSAPVKKSVFYLGGIDEHVLRRISQLIAATRMYGSHRVESFHRTDLEQFLSAYL